MSAVKIDVLTQIVGRIYCKLRWWWCEGGRRNYVSWNPESVAFLKQAYRKNSENLMMTVIVEGKELLSWIPRRFRQVKELGK